ncbi:MAG: hypothetical protein HC906_11230 [Bacteroidales bacterium]|nr:hypothetical protein [Bacteroidales bacterium]
MIKYGVRILTGIVIHFLIKIFDETFKGKLFTVDLRGILFLLFVVVFTLLVWELGDVIKKKVVNSVAKNDFIRQYIVLTFALSGYGFVVAFFVFITLLFV